MTSRDIVFGWDRPKIVHERMSEDEVRTFEVNGSVFATKLGTSLSSAAWSVEEGDATVGASTETSDNTTADVTATDIGTALIKVVLTFADGQKGVQYIRIWIRQIEEYEECYG